MNRLMTELGVIVIHLIRHASLANAVGLSPFSLSKENIQFS